MDGDHVVGGRQGALVRLDEGADRGLGGRREQRRRAHPVEELLLREHAVGERIVAERDRERHDRDAVALGDLRCDVRG